MVQPALVSVHQCVSMSTAVELLRLTSMSTAVELTDNL